MQPTPHFPPHSDATPHSELPTPSNTDLGEMDAALHTAGADMSPLQYVRTLKRNNLTGAAKPGGGAGGDSGLSALTSQTNILDWADKIDPSLPKY